MPKPNILLLETISNEADTLLREYCNVINSHTPQNGKEYTSNVDIDAIITRGKGLVDQALIDSCKGLKIISRCGVGLDNIDVDFASSRKVKVVNAPGSNASTVAEHTFSLMLSLQRKMGQSIQNVRQGNWEYRKSYDGDDLRGKQLGIIGMGRIGQKVANIATAFGMKVSFWNRSKVSSPFDQIELIQLMQQSNVISIHLARTDETIGLISPEHFKQMSRMPILINTARGGIVRDGDVLQAIKKGHISGFGADVLEKEPPNLSNELLRLSNVEITPHSASLTRTTYNEMCVLTVQNTIALLNGRDIDSQFIYNRKSID